MGSPYRRISTLAFTAAALLAGLLGQVVGHGESSLAKRNHLTYSATSPCDAVVVSNHTASSGVQRICQLKSSLGDVTIDLCLMSSERLGSRSQILCEFTDSRPTIQRVQRLLLVT